MTQIYAYALAVALFLADRITKQLVLTYAAQPYAINDALSFELIINRGVSWSMFHSDNSIIFGLVTLVVIAITASLAWFAYTQLNKGYPIIGELLVFAGACSNIIDRFVYCGVIDFIVITIGGWTCPVFNVADVAIIVGVTLMLWINYRDL